MGKEKRKRRGKEEEKCSWRGKEEEVKMEMCFGEAAEIDWHSALVYLEGWLMMAESDWGKI